MTAGGCDPDRAQVRRAAMRVGLWVGAASAVVLTVGVGVLLGVILATRRRDPDDRPGIHLPGRFVVGADRIVPVVLVLGAIGILLLAAVAWVAARRAVRPLGAALRVQRDFVSDASQSRAAHSAHGVDQPHPDLGAPAATR